MAAAPYAVFLLLSLISWNRWIEPFVDSGRELAVPWRLAHGERLYADVRYPYGPLGPYLAAAVDAVAGRSIPARVVLAAAVALAHVEALRRLARRFLSPGKAALAASLAVGTAFFLRPGGCYLFPYSLDTSIAVTALTWALALASGGTSAERERLAGLALTGALLARPELGLAAIAALLAEQLTVPRALRLGAAPVGAAGLAYAAVSAGLPVSLLRREGWLAFTAVPAEFRRVYVSFAGLDRPGLRLAELALAATVLVLAAALLILFGFLAARAAETQPGRERAVVTVALALTGLGAYVAFRPPQGLAAALDLVPPLVRILPPLVLFGALRRLAARLARRAPGGALADFPDAVVLVAAFFSARMLFAAGYVGPYSAFFLPLVLVVSCGALFRLAGRAASAVREPSGSGSLERLAGGALGIFLACRIAQSADLYRSPSWSLVPTPAGSLYVPEPAAGAARAALLDLAARVPPGGTLSGFPEAGFFNYALGFRNRLAHDQFFPGHLDAAAEDAAARSLAASPPDAIVLVNVLTIGHGAEAFGRDYLTELWRTVESGFVPAVSFGPGAGPAPRIGDPQFFIEVRVPAGEKPR